MNMALNGAFASNSPGNAVSGDASLETSLDEGWIGALSRLGRLVMVLHRLAAGSSFADFQRLAFEALNAELPFDSGIWASGSLTPGLSLHAIHGHRQPAATTRAWQEFAPRDPLLTETLRRSGHTLRASADGAESCPPFRPEAGDQYRRHGMAQMLATSFVDPAQGLVESFGLYRNDPKARFNEPERLLVQHALPHMLEAWRHLRRRLPLEYLTPREAEIARRFGLGSNYRQIADDLHISPATVRNHLANIYAKAGISNKVELARLFD